MNRQRLDWYKAVTEKIGGRKCIKHRHTKELCLAGRYGEIWPYSDTHYVVLITSPKIARRELPHLAESIGKKDETLHKFPIADVKRWIKALRITRNRNSMIKYANAF